MDLEHRIGFIGIGAAAVALVATQFDSVSLALANLNPFRSETPVASEGSIQRGWELMLQKDFDVRPGGSLSVEVADADVTVRSGTASEATVKVLMNARDRSWGREVFDRMNFDVALHGDEVNVVAREVRSDWGDERGGIGFQVEVTVPSSFDAVISTADGDISVSSLEGDFELETADGDISVGSLSGSMHIRTSDGDVSAEALSGSSVSVRTSDGDVSIGALAGPAEISTSDGDIRVYLEGADEIRLRTGDGDITIYAEPTLSANVDFSGEEVHLASAFALSDGRVSEHGARGTFNDGGPTLHAHTGDGTIVVREKRLDR
jgi:hypothetical protein